jgi:hypothetical protein
MFLPTTLRKSFEFSMLTAAWAASAPSSASSSWENQPLRLFKHCITPIVRWCWLRSGTQSTLRVR